ncbi:glycosyltransferase family A protein [Flavobacterium sp.]|uniref:glycosyltransferase family 2 protein n=1 Tax=Flavobacterium sp. TaxID=239 RepID=UPI00286A8217|nr:glycosyltransferase family A protein [Flavobacterium sp.]
MPQFSVIIPVYNKENFIENTLKSVLQQSFTDFELILVNDGSTDLSEAKIKTFTDSRIRYYSKENGGVSTARNLGIELATASYITFLDADDYWYPNFLNTINIAIQRFPDHKIFSAAIEVETPKKVFPAQYSIPRKNEYEVVDYFDASMKTTIICTSCAVFHKNVFEKMGVFDTQIRSGQDTDMWIRIGLVYPVVFSWKILARYAYDANSLSKKKEYLSTKMDFSKFNTAEKENPKLKKFLDLNRYGLAIKSKLHRDKINFIKFKNDINPGNLTFKKRILLLFPEFILRILLHINLFFVQLGFRKSVFK